MKKELDELLCKKYPKIFRDRNAPSNQTSMCWGFPGDGWFTIIDNLCGVIQRHIDNKLEQIELQKKYNKEQMKEIPQLVATQVKEKFGALRFYVNFADDFIHGAIAVAESLSYSTCELCGSTEDVGHTTGYVQTLCKKCVEEKKIKNWDQEED